jgi:hypothetical protein
MVARNEETAGRCLPTPGCSEGREREERAVVMIAGELGREPVSGLFFAVEMKGVETTRDLLLVIFIFHLSMWHSARENGREGIRER